MNMRSEKEIRERIFKLYLELGRTPQDHNYKWDDIVNFMVRELEWVLGD